MTTPEERARAEVRRVLCNRAADPVQERIAMAEAYAGRVTSGFMTTGELVEQAATCPFAWDGCVILLDDLTSQGVPIPDALAAFAVQSLWYADRGRPSSRGPRRKRFRDGAIQTAVRLAVMEGLPAYSNSDTKTGITACDVVAEVLRDDCDDCDNPPGSGAVRDIWINRPGSEKSA